MEYSPMFALSNAEWRMSYYNPRLSQPVHTLFKPNLKFYFLTVEEGWYHWWWNVGPWGHHYRGCVDTDTNDKITMLEFSVPKFRNNFWTKLTTLKAKVNVRWMICEFFLCSNCSIYVIKNKINNRLENIK